MTRMADSEEVSLPYEYLSSLRKSTGERFNHNFSQIPPSSSNSMKGVSFNVSVENPSNAKRKIEFDGSSHEEKRRRELPANLTFGSPWEFRRLKADLIDAQAQILKLEDRIDELHKKNKETVIFFDKEKTEMKLQLESSRNAVKDLEYRLHKVRKREADSREEFSESIKMYEFDKAKLNEKIVQLEHESRELKMNIDEMKSNSEKSIKHFEDELSAGKEENARLQLSVDEKEKLIQSLEERLSAVSEVTKNVEKQEEELQILKLRIQELESEKADYEEARQITINLSEKVLRLSEIEKELMLKRQEVTNLRQTIHNKVLLEEEVHDLKVKLAAVEDQENQLPILKAKTAELEMELKKWVAVAEDFTDESTAESLRNYIGSLQEKELTFKIDVNNLNAIIKTSEAKLRALQSEIEHMKQVNEKLESVMQKLKVEVVMLRKKSILVTRERDSYRQQLDMYEKDLTISGLTSENLNNEICAQLRERIKTLEKSLDEYRQHIAILETQLKESQGEDQIENINLINKLKEDIRQLECSNKFLSQIRDELEKKLEGVVSKGDFLSSDTKVLHLRQNPVTESQKKQIEDLNALREECDRLKSRILLLERGEVMDITQKVGENIQLLSSQRVKDLEKELESANLKMQRLKEGYRKTSQEFCDVSYMLLGYRINLVSNNKLYKLYNMYSTSPSDYLMFQLTKNGTMEMLGTPFAESLSKLVDEHLYKGNSIPAFLAAVTLSLYSSTEQSEEDDDEDPETEGPPEEIELD